ncbi:MAG: ABC transporter permease [Planctomycetes bacterium]|jgi:peptide/nickel transport system permease protein|nr:ABC transporter permease [Planctomycetota bacterium]MBT6452832.1 ABC transporter permease [Planctomycetota bacterium]MBT6541634.1 ABC transporter permease [Planctomycetota bacterium]MBT6785070.1 ABC transporter permease [Planctomycetota bacterium]MBT6967553.1 ABC transporter permease [Planctomycetota bacterium]
MKQEEQKSTLPPPRGPWAMLWHRLRKNRLAMIGAAILLVLYTLSCFGGFIAPYSSNETNKYTVKYGPMLLGGYSIDKVGEVIDEDENYNEIILSTYERNWNWFEGGVHFHNSANEFTFRPHVHPLREYQSWDEYGESEYLMAVDRTISLPIQFFVEREESHELFSLCGFFPIQGKTHLMGLDTEQLPSDRADLHPGLFLLGTDILGRDLWTRILYGGQVSLSVGLIGIMISISIGLVIGGIAGYFGGQVDFWLMRLVELLLAIPGLYLILTLRYAIPDKLSPRQTYMMIVAILAIVGWASTGRMIRGMVLSLRESEYALAAKALGGSSARVILRHLLPNTASIVIVTATLYVPYYILGEVALSFLGFGITEPDSSWGLLLKDCNVSEVLKYNPWLITPGFFIFLAVLAYNFLGDGLRDAADPRAYLGLSKKAES